MRGRSTVFEKRVRKKLAKLGIQPMAASSMKKQMELMENAAVSNAEKNVLVHAICEGIKAGVSTRVKQIAFFLKKAPPKPNEKILDIGTGRAVLPIIAAGMRPKTKYICADINPKMLEQAVKLSRKAGADIELLRADLSEKMPHFPLKDKSINQVWLCSIVVPRKGRLLEEIHRTLRDDGVVKDNVCMEPTHSPKKTMHLVKEMYEKHGFVIKEIKVEPKKSPIKKEKEYRVSVVARKKRG